MTRLDTALSRINEPQDVEIDVSERNKNIVTFNTDSHYIILKDLFPDDPMKVSPLAVYVYEGDRKREIDRVEYEMDMKPSEVKKLVEQYM